MRAICKEAIRLFKERLEELYGERLVAVVLYGSCARGEEDEESDVDLLVLLKDIDDFWKEVHTIAEIEAQIHELFDYQVLLSAIPARAKDFHEKETPIFINARKEGISL